MTQAGPSRAALDRALGEALAAQRLDEAEALCRAIVAAHGDDADAWYNLGYVLRCQRKFGPALDAYGRAIAAGLARVEDAHVNRAAILSEHLLRNNEALAELQAALAANPASVPVLQNLGQLHEDRGEPEAAISIYRRLVEEAPGVGRAHARLASLQLNLGRAGVDDTIAALQRAAQITAARSEDQAEVVMALGQAFEKAGNHRLAFQAYAMANDIARAQTHPGARYSPEHVESLIDATIAAWPAADAAAPGASVDAPLFICGMLRSGSTLAERILSQHPRVTGGGELEAIPAIAGQIEGYPARGASLSHERIAELRETYLAEAQIRFGNFDLLVDKRPDNFLHLGLIKRLFPAARIINTRRAPEDVMISILGNLFGPAVPYAHSQADIAHWQAQHDRLMAHWQSLWPDDILTLSYEALIADPEGEARRLLAHCGLEWHAACLELPPGAQTVRTLSQWQVREPINSRSLGRARSFAPWLMP